MTTLIHLIILSFNNHQLSAMYYSVQQSCAESYWSLRQKEKWGHLYTTHQISSHISNLVQKVNKTLQSKTWLHIKAPHCSMFLHAVFNPCKPNQYWPQHSQSWRTKDQSETTTLVRLIMQDQEKKEKYVFKYF